MHICTMPGIFALIREGQAAGEITKCVCNLRSLRWDDVKVLIINEHEDIISSTTFQFPNAERLSKIFSPRYHLRTAPRGNFGFLPSIIPPPRRDIIGCIWGYYIFESGEKSIFRLLLSGFIPCPCITQWHNSRIQPTWKRPLTAVSICEFSHPVKSTQSLTLRTHTLSARHVKTTNHFSTASQLARLVSLRSNSYTYKSFALHFLATKYPTQSTPHLGTFPLIKLLVRTHRNHGSRLTTAETRMPSNGRLCLLSHAYPRRDRHHLWLCYIPAYRLFCGILYCKEEETQEEGEDGVGGGAEPASVCGAGESGADCF